MPLTILSVDIPIPSVDEQINHRINMLEEMNRQAFTIDGYKDFHSMETLEFDLLTDLFMAYISDNTIGNSGEIIRDICHFMPVEPLDTFLCDVVIPVLLDFAVHNVKMLVDSNPDFNGVELLYDTVYRKEGKIYMTFKCVI